MEKVFGYDVGLRQNAHTSKESETILSHRPHFKVMTPAGANGVVIPEVIPESHWTKEQVRAPAEITIVGSHKNDSGVEEPIIVPRTEYYGINSTSDATYANGEQHYGMGAKVVEAFLGAKEKIFDAGERIKEKVTGRN